MRIKDLSHKKGDSVKAKAEHYASNQAEQDYSGAGHSNVGLDVDFGTYHHTTPEESRETRKKVEDAFTSIFASLYPPDSVLEILDAGCGLGFLSYVAARHFKHSKVTGIDIFDHESLSEASIGRARENMKSLGLNQSVTFVEHDLTKPTKPEGRYDLIISSLVFHNLGKKRFGAYENVFSALKRGGYFVIGDLFPNEGADIRHLTLHSTVVREIEGEGSGRWKYKIKVLRKK